MCGTTTYFVPPGVDHMIFNNLNVAAMKINTLVNVSYRHLAFVTHKKSVTLNTCMNNPNVPWTRQACTLERPSCFRNQSVDPSTIKFKTVQYQCWAIQYYKVPSNVTLGKQSNMLHCSNNTSDHTWNTPIISSYHPSKYYTEVRILVSGLLYLVAVLLRGKLFLLDWGYFNCGVFTIAKAQVDFMNVINILVFCI